MIWLIVFYKPFMFQNILKQKFLKKFTNVKNELFIIVNFFLFNSRVTADQIDAPFEIFRK